MKTKLYKSKYQMDDSLQTYIILIKTGYIAEYQIHLYENEAVKKAAIGVEPISTTESSWCSIHWAKQAIIQETQEDSRDL